MSAAPPQQRVRLLKHTRHGPVGTVGVVVQWLSLGDLVLADFGGPAVALCGIGRDVELA